MDLPVKSHIDRIHREIEALNLKLMNAKDRAAANEAEAIFARSDLPSRITSLR
jgi:hypothetical protein